MANPNVELVREELERIYSPPPPMNLIFKILTCGTVGVFLAVVTVRAIAPNRLPQLIFTHQNNETEKLAN